MAQLAADLVRRQVTDRHDRHFGVGLVAKTATTAIPIVSRARRRGPSRFCRRVATARRQRHRGGPNQRGARSKRLDLLHELVPAARRFAALINPDDPNAGH